jgi:antitoxin (DNA-binding transcriptional repressor) of toxin-antitoxin stability system
MAANKQAKQKDKRAKPRAREAMSQTGLPKPKSPPKAKPKPKPKPREARGPAAKLEIPDGARALPLAALRSALGTEVDRVRQLGGYTLILRRGRPVAAVIPYEEFRRYRMNGRFEEHERAERGARLVADIRRLRDAIASEWDDGGRPPEAGMPAAQLINKLREERTQRILDAASSGSRDDEQDHGGRSRGQT